AAINYSASSMSSLAISGGTAGNTFTVTGTPTTSFAEQTTINSGSGADTVNVRAAATALQVNTQGSNDIVNISSDAPTNTANLAGLVAAVSVDGGAGSNTLNVSEAGRAVADTVSISGTQIASAVVPFTINYAATGGSFGNGVGFTSGSLADTVNILSTTSG